MGMTRLCVTKDQLGQDVVGVLNDHSVMTDWAPMWAAAACVHISKLFRRNGWFWENPALLPCSIETSLLAKPVYWEARKTIKEVFGSYYLAFVGTHRLNHVKPDGSLKIGCMEFTAREIDWLEKVLP